MAFSFVRMAAPAALMSASTSLVWVSGSPRAVLMSATVGFAQMLSFGYARKPRRATVALLVRKLFIAPSRSVHRVGQFVGQHPAAPGAEQEPAQFAGQLAFAGFTGKFIEPDLSTSSIMFGFDCLAITVV